MLAKKPLPYIATIRQRLAAIFPEGLSDRLYVTRESAARVIFVMLYVDAVEGCNIWLAPKHVYRMTDRQASLQGANARRDYYRDCMRPGYNPIGERWYADNSREQVRDESLKDGLVAKGAVVIDSTVPTTSSRGRYALRKHFAKLFLLSESEFVERAQKWRERFLAPPELARVRIVKERQRAEGDVTVQLPNGETRLLGAGPSSLITKAVIEEFTLRFLHQAAVLWISESGRKSVIQDDRLMRELGLPIDQKKLLPDLILCDLGRPQVLLVFVEIVATDGPVTENRKQELLKLTDAAGYERSQVAFVSAFEQRASAPLKKRLSGIAVDSLVWCMAEPELLIWFGSEQPVPFRSVP